MSFAIPISDFLTNIRLNISSQARASGQSATANFGVTVSFNSRAISQSIRSGVTTRLARATLNCKAFAWRRPEGEDVRRYCWLETVEFPIRYPLSAIR